MFQHKYTRSGKVVRFQIRRRDGSTHTVTVDEGDFDKVQEYKWCLHVAGPKRYVMTSWYSLKERVWLPLSRLILGQPPEGYEVHHRNSDTMDYRRSNITFMRHMEIMQATPQDAPNTGERGIHYDKRSGRYFVSIHVMGRRYCRATNRGLAKAVAIRDEMFREHGYRVEGRLRIPLKETA